MSTYEPIETIINGILDREGGEFTDDPKDSGGPTKWGITLETFSMFMREPMTSAALKEMRKQTAFEIYLSRYFRVPNFDDVARISLPIAAELTDTGVNLGPAQAAIFLQRALNAFNRQGKLYPDVQVDGGVGRATIAALNRYIVTRGADAEKVMLRALNGLQCAFYIKLAEGRPKDEEFAFGWIANRVS